MKIDLSKYQDDIPENAVAIEISGKLKDAVENYNNGLFNVWTHKRIKGAFNNGNGTMKDFQRYIEDNKSFCTIIYL